MEKYELVNGGCITHFDTGAFNWYVISEGGRLTLVDAGFPGHFRIFLKGIRELGYEVNDVAAIILTHAHADHMGFIERLRRASKAPVYVHAADRHAAQRPLQLPWRGLLSNAWRPYVARILTYAAGQGVFTMPGITTLVTMADGAQLDVPGRPTVLHLPGHTPGEVALFLPESKVLLSGDTLVTRHLLTGAHGQPQLTPHILNHDAEGARRSLDRLRELGPITLLPGHGKAWHGQAADAVEIVRRSPR